MSDSYVRVYKGPEGSNLIGFSASVLPEQVDDFPGFMQAQGYEVEEYDTWGENAVESHREAIKAVGGVSLTYFGIRPPLKEEHHRTLVQWIAEHSSIYSDGWLIDDRATPAPIQPFSRKSKNIIGYW